MRFEDLHLQPALLRAVQAEGYLAPTPIQAKAIPHLLAGRDLVGLAQTGTGKTAAFALPVLQRLGEVAQGPRRKIRCLVLTPTRELAAQVGQSFSTYGRHTGLRATVIFGGVGQSAQVSALRQGVDVLVATPGRLLDLMNQKLVPLEAVEILVLDEADRMLDMGFINDVRKVIARLPQKRQTLLFSATMPDDIQKLVDSILIDPVQVAVNPVSSTVDRVEQSVYFVEKNDKRSLLIDLARDPSISRALVFTRTKHGANRVAESLDKAGVVAEAIHGNKSQGARERALSNFRGGSTRFLVATDIAARGIDIEGITHVINYDLPNVPESYVHRIGRTARAGASGIALSFCDADERDYLAAIERLTRRKVEVVREHGYASKVAPPPAEPAIKQPAPHRPSEPKGNRELRARPHRKPVPSNPSRREQTSPSRQAREQGQQKPLWKKPSNPHPTGRPAAGSDSPRQHPDRQMPSPKRAHPGRGSPQTQKTQEPGRQRWPHEPRHAPRHGG